MMRHRWLSSIFVLSLLLSPLTVRGADAGLKPGDHVAIVGDSITEQRLYSVYMEDYLLMCRPQLKLRVTQFGWGGETAPGFAGRMENDTLRFQPTAMTTCFGMNDGGYSPMTPDKAQRYREGQTTIVRRAKRAGVRLIVVGSPGCVDADTFHNDPAQAAMYNKTLLAERDIARDVAQAEGVAFADVIDPMLEVMAKAKARYGRQYPLAGGDGVHPGPNGHLVMAYALLKGLGCDGDIGRITVDLAEGKAEGSEGHEVLSVSGEVVPGRVDVKVKSGRYPFCFQGDPASPNATRGVIRFFPFNQDLNRLLLVVRGGQAARYQVTWGKCAKSFTAAALAAGVNLAAEFLDNPFSGPFEKVEAKIRQQQDYETPLVKNLIHSLPEYKRMLPTEEEATLDRLAAEGIRRDKALFDAAAAAVVPVEHEIRIQPAP
jgi:lysophospholipase L1-like esterase